MVYFFRTFEKVPLSLAACKSNNRSGSRGTTGGQVLETRDKSSENTPGSDPIKKRGIPSPAGKRKWYASTVKSIITNEKYKGDALLQKQYTTDFLQKKRKKNEGEIPQYYVEGHHKPIILPPVFDYVQAEIVRRSKMGRYSGADIFANKVRCGCCGNWYGAKVWHSQDKYRRVVNPQT